MPKKRQAEQEMKMAPIYFDKSMYFGIKGE